MKKIAIILLFFGLFLAHFANAANSLRVRSDYFFLKNVRETPYVQDGITNQYIQANENLDNWTKMVVIQTYPHVEDPIKATEHLFNTYRKRGNVILTPIENAGRSSAVFSFILLNIEYNPTMYEGNVVRFSRADKGGIVVMQYIERVPVENKDDLNELKRIAKDLQNRLTPVIRAYKKTSPPDIVKEMQK